MRVLAIETSGRSGAIAAIEAGPDESIVRHETILPTDRRTAQTLVPAIAELLAKCGWQANELELVCVAVGPGSFTGLRLGVTTAKTLAYAAGAPVAAVNTLAAIAGQSSADAARRWAVLDAGRNELFAACYPDPATTQIVSIDQWLAQLRPGDAASGPPLRLLAARVPTKVVIAPESKWHPSATTIGRLGIAAHAKGLSEDPFQVVPQYYRKSAAEEKASSE
jgi:tRNA threonylcarbamoyladenosine biosynthesis protein TsaB